MSSTTIAPMNMWNCRDSSCRLAGISNRRVELCYNPFSAREESYSFRGPVGDYQDPAQVRFRADACIGKINSYYDRQLRPRRAMKSSRPREGAPAVRFKYSLFLPITWNVVTQPRGNGGRIMLEILKSLQQDESGQDLIEYALIAALIALAAVTGMKGLATGINGAFTTVSTSLTAAIT